MGCLIKAWSAKKKKGLYFSSGVETFRHRMSWRFCFVGCWIRVNLWWIDWIVFQAALSVTVFRTPAACRKSLLGVCLYGGVVYSGGGWGVG